MKLQQLRYIWEVARHDLNVSHRSGALHLAARHQQTDSHARRRAGRGGFARSGKHLTHITPAGQAILQIAGEILQQTESIRRVSQEFRDESRGELSIATTHTQARYALPPVIHQFTGLFPDVSLHMHQGTPMQISEMAANGSVDFAIATEALDLFSDLIMMPCYRWNRTVVVPEGHPLADVNPLTLEALAEYPLLPTYSASPGAASWMMPLWTKAWTRKWYLPQQMPT